MNNIFRLPEGQTKAALLPDSNCKVLLVNDDRFMHEMMALLHGKTKFSLVSATNAEDAMK